MGMLLVFAALCGWGAPDSRASDFVVYSVYRGLDLGNPQDTPQKDFFVNLGSAQGAKAGSILKVTRKLATYDVLNEKLYKDVTFPIAELKVIHAEGNAAICRLEKMLPADKTPSLAYRTVMVGDAVSLVK